MKAFDFRRFAKGQKEPKSKAYYKLVLDVAEAVQKSGGRAFIVGGFVRDAILGHPAKDVDLEVYKVKAEQLKKLLAKFGKVNLVGESFSVFKIGNLDISLPRKDSKTGKGHRGFKIVADPKLTLKQGMQRRDFTINALALDPLTGEIFDEVGGLKDHRQKTLRAVNLKLFGDDPLRVLRAVQFAGRLSLTMEPKTLSVCKKLVSSGQLDELSGDRIREEWVKLWLKAKTPSFGLRLAKEINLLKKYFPALERLAKTKQEPDWHPEGDVFVHTCEVVDRAAQIAEKNHLDNDQRLVLMLGSLCHDLGKALTTKPRLVNGKKRITSHGHEEAGLKPAQEVLHAMHLPKEAEKKVLPLVKNHMFIFHSRKQKMSDSSVRRLIVSLQPATLQELVGVAEADYPGYKPAIVKLLKHADRLDKNAAETGKIKPILQGRDLIKLGFKPGPEMGKLLKVIFQKQIDGKIKTLAEAQKYAKRKK